MDEGNELINQKETDLLRWESPEFVDYSRSWLWFLVSGIVLLGIVAYSVYRADWFMVGISIIIGCFLYWYQAKKPSLSSFRATQLGIYINDKFYPYSEIHSFWMFLKTEPKKLNIIFRKNYLPQLTVLIDSVDPVTVRTVLSKFVPEQTDKTESAMDKISRLLRL